MALSLVTSKSHTPPTMSGRGHAGGVQVSTGYKYPSHTPEFSGWWSQLGHSAQHIMEQRSTRVIAEDLIGFGVLRTLFDLVRGFFYSDDPNKGFFQTIGDNIRDFRRGESDNDALVNKSMARERIIREGGNIFSANFLGGLAFATIAWSANQLGKGTMAQQHASLETLEVFAHVLNTSANQQEFIDNIATYLAKGDSDKAAQLGEQLTQLAEKTSTKQRQNHLNALRQMARSHIQGEMVANHPPDVQKTWGTLANKLNRLLKDEPLTNPRRINKRIDKLKRHLGWAMADYDKAIQRGKNLPANEVLLGLAKGWDEKIITNNSAVNASAKAITHILDPNATTFDLQHTLPTTNDPHRFNVSTLATDISEFLNRAGHAAEQKSTNWQKAAQGLVKRTQRLAGWATPLAYAAAFTFTVLVPVFNKKYTEKLDNTESYPGVKGLKELKPVNEGKKGFFEEYLPHVTAEAKKGNYWPLALGLIPLPLAAGLVNNHSLNTGDLKNVWVNPFKNFGRKLLRMFQFRKGFPFVSVQQIAALCATVMCARMLTVREGTEGRERLVDTYAGWALWIAAIPNLHKWIAGRIDKARGTKLTKHLPNGARVMREGNELATFFKKNTVAATQKILKPLDKWTFGIMVALMGIIEPLIAIKWTEHQIRKEQQQGKSDTPNIPSGVGTLPQAINHRPSGVSQLNSLPRNAGVNPLVWPPNPTIANDPMMHIATVQQPIWQPQPAAPQTTNRQWA